METRKQVGPDYRLMVDCYMSLDVPYAIDLANAVKEANLYWIASLHKISISECNASGLKFV